MFRHAHSVAKQMPQREKISILNESLTFKLSMEYEIVILVSRNNSILLLSQYKNYSVLGQ